MPKSSKKTVGKIHQGDCVKGLRALAEGSIDLAFADPPFNIGYEYDEYDDRLEADKYVDWCSEWMSEVHRVLTDTGSFWLAIGDDFAAELKIAAQKEGFHTRNWVIWYYTFGVHCKSKFTRSHTHLLYFTKDKKEFTFNFGGVAVPSARQLVYNDKRSNPAGRSPDDTWILRPQDCEGFQDDEDTWYFPRVAGTFKERAGFHNCQMPEQLMARIIRGCSNEGDTVLDPFAGSATTLAVAKKLGRQFIGFELSKEYVKFGTNRLAKSSVGDALQGAKEPRVSAPATKDGKPLKTPKTKSKTLSRTKMARETVAKKDTPRKTKKQATRPQVKTGSQVAKKPSPKAKPNSKVEPKSKAKAQASLKKVVSSKTKVAKATTKAKSTAKQTAKPTTKQIAKSEAKSKPKKKPDLKRKTKSTNGLTTNSKPNAKTVKKAKKKTAVKNSPEAPTLQSTKQLSLAFEDTPEPKSRKKTKPKKKPKKKSRQKQPV